MIESENPLIDYLATEESWRAYHKKMLDLRDATNLAGTGLTPSWRDWHAGWDAAITYVTDKEKS